MQHTWGASWELVGVPAAPLDFTFTDVLGNNVTARYAEHCSGSMHLSFIKLLRWGTSLLMKAVRVYHRDIGTKCIRPDCRWPVLSCRGVAVDPGSPGLYPTDVQFPAAKAQAPAPAPAPSAWHPLLPGIIQPPVQRLILRGCSLGLAAELKIGVLFQGVR